MKIIAIDETEKHGFTITLQNHKGLITNMPIPLETYLALLKMGITDRSAIPPHLADIFNKGKHTPAL